MNNIETVIPVKLRDIKDLARLASSMVSLGHSTYLIYFKYKERHIYGIFMVFRDYYKYYGIPMFYYVPLDEPLKGTYILIKIDNGAEKVEVDYGARHGWISLPIIELTEKPIFIELYE